MRTRRTIGVLCALFLIVLAASGSGSRISNRGARTYFWFWDFDSSAYLDSSASRMIVAYPSYLAGNDTTGAGTALTFMTDGSDAWYLDVDKDEIWRIWKYDTLSESLLIDSVYTPGGQVGDSAIASVAAFMPGVIPPWALAADSAFALDSLRVEGLGADWLYADSAVIGYMEHTPRSNKAYIDSILPNDSTSVYVSVTSTSILNGTIINEDVNASAAIALSKLATTGTLESDAVETDTIKAKSGEYVVQAAPWKIPASMAVLDTFIHYPGMIDLAPHTIGFPGANVGDWFIWLSYPGESPPKTTTTFIPFSFAVRCTIADSVTVAPQLGASGVVDYGAGDSIIAIVRLGDWLGD